MGSLLCCRRHLRRLGKLVVDGCAILTEPELQATLRHLNGLRQLVVNKCSFIAAKAMWDVVPDLPNLELLEHNLIKLLDRKAAALALRRKQRQMNMQSAESLAAYDERHKYSRAVFLGLNAGSVAKICPSALQNLLMELGIGAAAGPGK